MADFEDVAGSTASGALTGFSAGGPWGAAAGGAIGLVSGLLSKKKKVRYNDPYKAQRDLAISDLMTGNYGQKAASIESAQIGNLARDQVEDFNNNPNLAGNASAQAGFQNKILTNAERGSQAAYVHGAQIDSENRARAGQLGAEGSRLAQSEFELNQSYEDRPTFGQQMLQSVLSTGTGLGLSKLTGGNGEETNDQMQQRKSIADTSVSNATIPYPLPQIDAPDSTAPDPENYQPSSNISNYFRRNRYNYDRYDSGNY